MVAPGGDVVGHVLVQEGGAARGLRVTVSLSERSPAFRATAFSAGGVIHEGDLRTGQAVAFRCGIPSWAAPGVKGKNGELVWELEAVADVGGRPDARAARVLDVRR